MRVLMGLIKSKDGVWYVRKKVPTKLEEPVARLQNKPRGRVSWLKRSLRTKDVREANVRAKPHLVEFDELLAKAAVLDKLIGQPTRLRLIPTKDHSLRHSLTASEMEQIAHYHYASVLKGDDGKRLEGLHGPVAADRLVVLKLALQQKARAYAEGNLSIASDSVDELLNIFGVSLDRQSLAYRQLSLAVLEQHVRAFEVLIARQNGNVIITPKVERPNPQKEITPSVSSGDTLRAAFNGWKKAKSPSKGTVIEFDYAVTRFAELHGDLALTAITRRHVREFREALQMIPVRRSGELRNAKLPELVAWAEKHPAAKRVSAATANKLLGGVQAVTVWGRDNGLIPEEQPWADPFARMRLDAGEPEREPWELPELRVLFSSPVYTAGKRPIGGRGEAAFWLPLLGLYTGARLGELAPLLAKSVTQDEATGLSYITVTEDDERETMLKTRSLRRSFPVHPELERLGFLAFVKERRESDGENAPLFPLLEQGSKGGFGESWSKWFGHYIRKLGIRNKDRVFHSFRHNFKDALRAQGVSEDINDALTGHSGGGTGRLYGAKDAMRRFGLKQLHAAISKVEYPGLKIV